MRVSYDRSTPAWPTVPRPVIGAHRERQARGPRDSRLSTHPLIRRGRRNTLPGLEKHHRRHTLHQLHPTSSKARSLKDAGGTHAFQDALSSGARAASLGRHFSIHARERDVEGTDANGSVNLDMTSVVLLARNPLETLAVNLERREVIVALDRHDVDALERRIGNKNINGSATVLHREANGSHVAVRDGGAGEG
jgi:hypothetical protein